mgnify:CR=1 FL=1
MATAAELTGEEIAAVAESLSDPANLNVDTMAAIMHRIARAYGIGTEGTGGAHHFPDWT